MLATAMNAAKIAEDMHKNALLRKEAARQGKRLSIDQKKAIPKAQPRPKRLGLPWFRRNKSKDDSNVDDMHPDAAARKKFARGGGGGDDGSSSSAASDGKFRSSGGGVPVARVGALHICDDNASKGNSTISSAQAVPSQTGVAAAAVLRNGGSKDESASATTNPQEDDTVMTISSSLTSSSKAAEAMSMNFMNEKLSDVTLEGRDGCLLKAAKYPLGCRNDMLRQVLYDDPAAKIVYMGDYSLLTLKALVEYCHTGSFHRTLTAAPTSESARGLVELSILAQDYEFEDLYEDSVESGSNLMAKDPSLACAVYDTCNYHSDLAVKALETIQEYPDQATVLGSPPGVYHLQRIERMDELLCTLEMGDAETLIHILHKWVVACGNDAHKQLYATQKVSDIPLDLLQTPFLDKECRQSGFFSDAVIDAIIAQRGPGQERRGILKQSSVSESITDSTAPMTPMTPPFVGATPGTGVPIGGMVPPGSGGPQQVYVSPYEGGAGMMPPGAMVSPAGVYMSPVGEAIVDPQQQQHLLMVQQQQQYYFTPPTSASSLEKSPKSKKDKKKKKKKRKSGKSSNSNSSTGSPTAGPEDLSPKGYSDVDSDNESDHSHGG